MARECVIEEAVKFAVGDRVVVDYSCTVANPSPERADYRSGFVRDIDVTIYGPHTHYIIYDYEFYRGEWWNPKYLIREDVFNSPLFKALK